MDITRTWPLSKSQVQLRQQFQSAIEAEIESKYVNKFLEIYDIHSRNEEDFISNILNYAYEVNDLNVNPAVERALNFYEHHKKILNPEFTPSKVQEEMVNRFAKLLYCPIDFELLEDAVTLPCGHSLNESSAINIHGVLKELGDCEQIKECSECRSPVPFYFVNDSLRKISSKIAKITETFKKNEEDPETHLERDLLANEFSHLLQCSKSKRPLTNAVFLPSNTLKNCPAYKNGALVLNNKKEAQTVNAECITGYAIPDFVIRNVAILYQKEFFQ